MWHPQGLLSWMVLQNRDQAHVGLSVCSKAKLGCQTCHSSSLLCTAGWYALRVGDPATPPAVFPCAFCCLHPSANMDTAHEILCTNTYCLVHAASQDVFLILSMPAPCLCAGPGGGQPAAAPAKPSRSGASQSSAPWEEDETDSLHSGAEQVGFRYLILACCLLGQASYTADTALRTVDS